MATDNSQCTVLVVDDVPVNVLLVKGMLAKQKFKVISASSGQQALDILTHERPDCILMDILMPNMNGFETTRAVRANPMTRDIPIIMLSALNSDADIKEGLEAGANEFVTKPFVQDRLISTIQSQITLATNRKEREEEENIVSSSAHYDNTMRLLAFVACQKQDNWSRLLTEMALCVPIELVNDDLLNESDHSAQGLINWTVRRMKNYYVRNAKISVNDTLSDVISLIKPATAVRGVTWRINLNNDASVSADPALFRAVLTNLISYACRLSTGDVQVNASVDGGLTNIVIATRTADEDTETTDMRVEIALELASKMNGAVVCERGSNGMCQFQILLQI
mgnify:FL=1